MTSLLKRSAVAGALLLALVLPAAVEAASPAAPRAKAVAPSPAPPPAARKPAARDAVAFDTLGGNLPSVVLAKDRPYLVVSDIYVPQGKQVGIGAGVVLLFKNFTSLHVMGALSARGSKEKPVVFTSVNDTAYNPASTVAPAPFDWNGIYIHEDGIGSELAFCTVLYSVEGIVAKTRFIRLDPCLLLHNGRANLTIEGEERKVTDQPYYYSLAVNDPSLKGVPLAVLRDPRAPLRNSLRYSGLGVAASGLVVGIVYASRYGASLGRFRSLSSTDTANLLDNSGAAWGRARATKNGDLAGMLVFLGLTALGAAGLGWSFTF